MTSIFSQFLIVCTCFIVFELLSNLPNTTSFLTRMPQGILESACGLRLNSPQANQLFSISVSLYLIFSELTADFACVDACVNARPDSIECSAVVSEKLSKYSEISRTLGSVRLCLSEFLLLLGFKPAFSRPCS